MASNSDRSFAGKVSSAVKANSNSNSNTVASQSPGDLDAALSRSIGARVKVTTSAPSVTLEGTLFTADPITNLVAINTSRLSADAAAVPPSKQPSDFHIIPVQRIQSFSILSLADPSTAGFENALPSIARLDLRALKNREAAAIQKLRERDASRGKGVTQEAQDIFDALARTLPTRWHETSIIVNDAVIIAAPYGPDNCTAPKDQANALVRVKKVLENERRKIAERNSRAAPAPQGATRKGG